MFWSKDNSTFSKTGSLQMLTSEKMYSTTERMDSSKSSIEIAKVPLKEHMTITSLEIKISVLRYLL